MKLTPNQSKALDCLARGRFLPTLVWEDGDWHARWQALDDAPSHESLDIWVDAFLREATMTVSTERAEDRRHETLHDAWMAALQSQTGLVRWRDDECQQFAKELEAWSETVRGAEAGQSDVVFSLTMPKKADGLFTLSTEIPKSKAAFLALGQATRVADILCGLRREGKRLALHLSRDAADVFLASAATALQAAGYSVTGVVKKANVSAEAVATADEKTKATPAVTCRVLVDGEAVSARELRFLLDQESALVFFRDRWIEVDRDMLKEALRALEKGLPQKTMPLSFLMGIGRIGSLEIDAMNAHGSVRGLLNDLRQRGVREKTALPKTFRGTLKKYQQEGFRWLSFMTRHHFGALLADDMGLGKTVQTIAWIAANKADSSEKKDPVLIVAPLSLLTNWRHEFASFAPTLSVYIHQGSTRLSMSEFRAGTRAVDVVLTSYAVLVRDHSLFAARPWEALVLDEAQAIKNPQTRVAQAVKALSPLKRVALTGTPIENSLLDIWSLEDFLNPHFLGDLPSFKARFVRPLLENPDASAGKRLKHALEPFILRRLKTAPDIAAELGEKHEKREWCVLSPAQREAYESALSLFGHAAHTPGDALALLTELKLVCDGFQEAGETALFSSGKFLRLVDLLKSIFDAGESALVFTQYAKVARVLCQGLSSQFGERVPFLHGDLSPQARDAEIAAFRTRARRRGTSFVLSLKAGGFGLNLTEATHVIHYDRWWNPAVEDQATDRAHRLGQSRDVFVHLLINEGTVEERIDEILRRKMTLRDLLADGQAFWKAVKLA